MAWLLKNQTQQENEPRQKQHAYTKHYERQQPQNNLQTFQAWQRDQIAKLRQVQYLKQKYDSKTDQELGKAFRELMNELYPNGAKHQ